jgi:glycosyltransferase involved in cell wall biosynthesis
LAEELGSINVQALIPARYIGAKALYFGKGMDAESFLNRHKPSILIVTKMLDEGPLQLAVAAEKRRIPIVGVFCDLHVTGESGTFGNPEIARRNRALCDLTSAVVAPTKYVADFVHQHYEMDCQVIEEPVEYPRCAPAFAPSQPMKILYTGHPSNHDTLLPGVRHLARFIDARMTLTIISSRAPDLAAIRKAAPGIGVSFVPWSMMYQFEALKWCDVVFVPSKPEPQKQAKGQLRVLSAIQCGRIAIAYPLPQYVELADYCYCGSNYADMLRSALKNPDEVRRRIKLGQQYIDMRFSPEACAEKWEKLIEVTLSNRAQSTSA